MKSTDIKTQYIRRVHAALAAKGMMDDKMDLVKQFTNGRATSTKDMRVGELHSLIDHLNGKESPSAAGDKMRKHIISMAHQMGWELPNGRADMPRIDAWCVKYGKYHRPLNEHNNAELQEIVTQFNIAYQQHIHRHGNSESIG